MDTDGASITAEFMMDHLDKIVAAEAPDGLPAGVVFACLVTDNAGNMRRLWKLLLKR